MLSYGVELRDTINLHQERLYGVRYGLALSPDDLVSFVWSWCQFFRSVAQYSTDNEDVITTAITSPVRNTTETH